MARNSPFSAPWFILLVAVIVVALFGLLNSGGAEVVPWRTDFAASQSEARDGNKPMLVYFTASWCGPCQTMKRTTWADGEVESALRDYVPVKIDVDANPQVATQYAIMSIPTMIVATSDGRPLASTTGLMRPDDFLTWLNDAPTQ